MQQAPIRLLTRQRKGWIRRKPRGSEAAQSRRTGPAVRGEAESTTRPLIHPMHLCSLVYAKPQCVQCDATKRDLNSRKIEHETVDLTQNPDAVSKVKELGYQRAPVVVTEEDHWSGYRPDKIKALDPSAGGRRQSGLDAAAPRSRIAL